MDCDVFEWLTNPFSHHVAKVTEICSRHVNVDVLLFISWHTKMACWMTLCLRLDAVYNVDNKIFYWYNCINVHLGIELQKATSNHIIWYRWRYIHLKFEGSLHIRRALRFVPCKSHLFINLALWIKIIQKSDGIHFWQHKWVWAVKIMLTYDKLWALGNVYTQFLSVLQCHISKQTQLMTYQVFLKMTY